MIFGAAPFGSCAYGTECGASTAPSTLVSYNGDGGVQSGGAATLIASWSYAASGGAQSSGVADVAAVVSPSHEASGGGQSGGSADIQYSAVVPASGGMQSGGAAVVAYQMAQDGDPYYDKVVLLMHMDGSDGSSSFPEVTGKTATPTDVLVSTDWSGFGSGSAEYTVGATDPRITLPVDGDFNMSSGDFTMEMTVRPSVVTGEKGLLSCYASNLGLIYGFNIRYSESNGGIRSVLGAGSGGTFDGFNSPWSPVADTEYKLAFEREGTTYRVYVDGSVIGTHTIVEATTLASPGEDLLIGFSQTVANSNYRGYVDEVRITKGVARYGGAYSVATQAFPEFGQYEVDGSGGSQSGGSANIVASWVHVASGGGQSAGAADVEATISGNVHVGEGGAQSGGAAAISVGIVLDAAGGAQSGGSAALAVSSVVSGSGGGSAAGVGSVQTTWVLEGSGGGQSAGAADVEFFSGSTSYVYAGTGGGQSGGVAAVLAGWSVSGVGGAQSGGAAVIESAGTYAYEATGGAASSGSAAIQFGPAIVGSGGAQAGGSADVDTNSAFVYEGSGGGVSGGAAVLLLAVALVAVGGAVAGGSADVSSNTKSEVFGTGFSIVKREPDGFSTIIRPYPEGG